MRFISIYQMPDDDFHGVRLTIEHDNRSQRTYAYIPKEERICSLRFIGDKNIIDSDLDYSLFQEIMKLVKKDGGDYLKRQIERYEHVLEIEERYFNSKKSKDIYRHKIKRTKELLYKFFEN